MYRLNMLFSNVFSLGKNPALGLSTRIGSSSSTWKVNGTKLLYGGETRFGCSHRSCVGIHSSARADKEIDFQEFQDLRRSGLTVIDVRDPKEIRASGTIPGSLNIPLQQVGDALAKPAEEFESAYGKSKPREKQPLMFLCQRGVRSKSAMERAARLGYNALSFRGGWETFSTASRKANQ